MKRSLPNHLGDNPIKPKYPRQTSDTTASQQAPTLACRICLKYFKTKEAIIQHMKIFHDFTDEEIEKYLSNPFSDLNRQSYSEEEEETTEETPELYNGGELSSDENKNEIDRQLYHARKYIEAEYEKSYGNELTVYCREIMTVNDLIDMVAKLLQKQSKRCFISIQTAYILKDIETLEYSLIYASTNTSLTLECLRMRKKTDLEEILKTLREYDWEAFFTIPKSGLIPVRFAYLRLLCYTAPDPLGALTGKRELPKELLQNKFLITKERNKEETSWGNKCLIESIIIHFKRRKTLLFGAKNFGAMKTLLLKNYCEEFNISAETFFGIEIEHLGFFEKLCQLKINLYSLQIQNPSWRFPKSIEAALLWSSTKKEKNSLHGICNIGAWQSHACYITDLNKFLGHFVCPICTRHYDRKEGLSAHIRKCTFKFKSIGQEPQAVYHGGEKFKGKGEIISELEFYLGEKLPDELKNIDYLAACDTECYFKKFPNPQQRGKQTRSISELEIFIIGFSSSVPGYEETKFFTIYDDPNFIDTFIKYIVEVSECQAKILQEKFANVYKLLKQNKIQAIYMDNSYGTKLFQNLTAKLDQYLQCLPIIFYNGRSFDIPLLRQNLIPKIIAYYGNKLSAVKTLMRGRQYLSVTTKHFKLMDELNFINGHKTYRAYIKENLNKDLKGFFPYTYIDSLEKLNEKKLPEYSWWADDLKKNENPLNLDYAAYCSYLESGKTSEEALNAMHLSAAPKPGPEVLQDLQIKFEQNNYKIIDLCKEYLATDVWPLCEVCKRKSQVFAKKFHIASLYRSFPSISSAALHIAMKDYLSNEDIYIPSQENYKLFSEKLIAGQSILFTREAIAEASPIKASEFGEQALTCQKIISYDASLMYGWALQTGIPVGPEIERLPENHFLPTFPNQKQHHNYNADRILTFLKEKYQLQHFQSHAHGHEFISPLTPREFRFDGYGITKSGRSMVIEIFGDMAHCCPIHPKDPKESHHTLRKFKKGPKLTYAEIAQRDQWRINEIQRAFEGAIIKIVYMCEFDRDFTSAEGKYHQEYSTFLQRHPEYTIDQKPLSDSEILNRIQNGQLYGFIHASFRLSPQLEAATDSFPIFFKKTNISIDDIGPIMKEYCLKTNTLQKPHEEIVSSHYGEDLLISTDLCKFYLDFGAEVYNIKKVIEFKRSTALKKLVDLAGELRYQGSIGNPEAQILAPIIKLLVLSIWGKTAENPNYRRKVRYLNSKGLARAMTNTQFVTAEYVGLLDKKLQDHIYELKKRPNNIHYSSPIQIASAVLSAAKLRILKFVYELIEANFSHRSFSYFTTQTDSVSLIICEPTVEQWIEKHVLPERREAFEKLAKEYLVIPGDGPDAKRSFFRAGVFKIEWQGEVALGISSKCYAVVNKDFIYKKLAVRGVPMSCAKEITLGQFYAVLRKHNAIVVQFKGFSYVLGQMLCEVYEKSAIKFLYIKRETLCNLETRTLKL